MNTYWDGKWSENVITSMGAEVFGKILEYLLTKSIFKTRNGVKCLYIPVNISEHPPNNSVLCGEWMKMIIITLTHDEGFFHHCYCISTLKFYSGQLIRRKKRTLDWKEHLKLPLFANMFLLVWNFKYTENCWNSLSSVIFRMQYQQNYCIIYTYSIHKMYNIIKVYIIFI